MEHVICSVFYRSGYLNNRQQLQDQMKRFDEMILRQDIDLRMFSGDGRSAPGVVEVLTV